MTKNPASVRATLVLLLLNAFVWLAFAIIVAAGLHPSIPGSVLIRWTMAILALLTASALTVLCVFLGRRARVAYYLALALLALLSILTVTDEVGLADLIVLVIVVVPALLLIKDRAWYLQREALVPGPK